MKVSFTMLCLFLLFIPSVAQHNYYFSAGVTAEGKGTIEQPYRSPEILSRIIFQPGDTVLFDGRDTIHGNISISNVHGNKNASVVFTSYAKKAAVIDGGNKEPFAIKGSAYFTIFNLSVKGAGRKTGNTTNGLKITDCSHFSLKHLDISGFQKSGLLMYNCVDASADYVSAHENGATGILVEGDYQKRISSRIHIVNCTANDNPGDPTNLDNHSGNGILVGNCKNILIEYCTATNNGWDMPRIGNGPVGIWAYEADSVIIQHCISYRNKTAKGASDGGGFDLDGGVTNSVIQYCLSYENWGTGYGIYQYYSALNWYNNTVRFCISINDGKITKEASSMLIWNGWNGDSTFYKFYAYNNFFYNDTKYAFSFSPLNQHKSFSFFNNIFIASDTSDIYNNTDSSKSDLFRGNIWMRKNGGFAQNGFTNLAAWAAATKYESPAGKLTGRTFQRKLFTIPSVINITNPRTLKTNPLLLSLCSSVLRNKGINIKKLFGIDTGGKDFFGNIINAADAGAPGICQKQ